MVAFQRGRRGHCRRKSESPPFPHSACKAGPLLHRSTTPSAHALQELSSRPMPIRIHSYPGGMFDNSPTFQRWVNEVEAAQVPKGRLRGWNASEVPSGLTCISCGRSPTLKRWAIIKCPSGTEVWHEVYLTDYSLQFLVALGTSHQPFR